MLYEDTRHSSRIQPDHWDIALPAPVCVCEVDPRCETLKVNGQSLGHSFALQGDHLSRARERGAKNRTPQKIKMEHNHGGLEDHFPF